MSKNSCADDIETAWNKLQSCWQGEAADRFLDEYISFFKEQASEHENACSMMEKRATSFLKDLQMFEQKIAND